MADRSVQPRRLWTSGELFINDGSSACVDENRHPRILDAHNRRQQAPFRLRVPHGNHAVCGVALRDTASTTINQHTHTYTCVRRGSTLKDSFEWHSVTRRQPKKPMWQLRIQRLSSWCDGGGNTLPNMLKSPWPWHLLLRFQHVWQWCCSVLLNIFGASAFALLHSHVGSLFLSLPSLYLSRATVQQAVSVCTTSFLPLSAKMSLMICI